METQRAAAFRRVETLLLDKICNVAIMGPAARTWREDVVQVEEIVEYLTYLNARIVIAGKLPFDMRVEESAVLYEASLTCAGPVHTAQRLLLKERDAAVLFNVDLVVAFPLPAADVTTADPLIETAILEGIPVLALYRDWSAKLVVDSASWLYT